MPLDSQHFNPQPAGLLKLSLLSFVLDNNVDKLFADFFIFFTKIYSFPLTNLKTPLILHKNSLL